MIATQSCNRQRLIGFLTDQLEIDDRLEFLAHLDACGRCWDEIYSARKAEHPHYYKSNNRRVRISDRDLKRIDRQPVEEDAEYQVA